MKPHQLAFWFLKTGSMEAAYKQVHGKLPYRTSIPRVFKNKTFQEATVYWLKKIRRAGLEFKLDNANENVNAVLEDLKNRMLNATSDEYEMYSKQYMAMMSIFGGNWSGYERVMETHHYENKAIFQGDARYLESQAVETELIDQGDEE